MDSNKKPIDIEINELPEESEESNEQSIKNEIELKPSGEDELPVFDSLDMSDYLEEEETNFEVPMVKLSDICDFKWGKNTKSK